MKLNGILAVAMMVGSMAALGCSKNTSTEASENEATSDTPVAEESGNVLVRRWYGYRGYRSASYGYGYRGYGVRYYNNYSYVPYGPPARRYEYVGRAPSSRHFWSNGSWVYTNNRYSWSRGRWDTYRPGYLYVQPHYETVGGRYRYIPGHWVR
jgi:hypothetical protein